MNVNIWQILLLMVALVSAYLLYQSVRRFRLLDSALALLVCLCTVAFLYGTIVIADYAPPKTLVARVHAAPVANPTNRAIPMLSVEVMLYGPDGKPTSDKTYLLLGDRWEMQADVLQVSNLLVLAGFHSGVKLTRLEGRYNDPHLEATGKHTVVTLGGGDDSFFLWTRSLSPVLAPVIAGSYGNAVSNGPGTYLMYASQSGLWAKGV